MRKTLTTVATALMMLALTTLPAFADTTYVVQKGDTLWKIAAANGSSIQSIVQKNNLTNRDYITIGQALVIPDSTSQVQRSLVATAESLLGKYPYVWGGDSPAQGGFDCSGFVHYVFQQNGIDVPRVSHDQADAGVYVPANRLQPGDLVFFVNTYPNNFPNHVTHVGLYIGNDQMIYSSSARNTVIITSLWANPYWSARYYGARRYF